MKKKIYKYRLRVIDRQTIKMPKFARVLSVGVQEMEVYIWAMIVPEAEEEDRVFEIFGTGHDIRYDMGVDREFVGTFQITNGKLFVGHVFERRN